MQGRRGKLKEHVRERIDPLEVYTVAAATKALGLTPRLLTTEIRNGRLRVSKRCGRRWVLGRWLLEWLARGEVRRQAVNGQGGVTSW